MSLTDVDSLEKWARLACRVGSHTDSAFLAFTELLKPSDPQLLASYHMLRNWLAFSIRDMVKLSAFVATSLTQIRRDFCLSTSSFSAEERDGLRMLPIRSATALFDPSQLASAIEAARRRQNDVKDASIARLAT